MSKGLAGWAYQNRRAGIIADTETDPRWHRLPGRNLPTRSAMAVPLLRRDLIIGILTLTHPEPNRFRERHVELLEAIAAQAASAIENAALYTRVNSERAMLQAIIAGVEDVILVTDLEGRLVLANPAARRSLGIDPTATGQAILATLGDPALLAFCAAPAGDAAGRRVKLQDGRVFDCGFVSVPGVGRVLGMHDVTTFDRLNALKSEFVSHVAHDLKSPLATMYGYAWLINDAGGLNDEEREFAQQIMRSIDRMRALIDNLLDIGRIEMGLEAEFEPVDLGAVARRALEQGQAPAQAKQVQLLEAIADGLPRVQGAPIRLEQAVANLIGNAIKFTPAGGAVTVSVAAEGGQVAVRVSDTGPGIPPAQQAKLFQKFSRLGRDETRVQEGHGLGLAIVKSIVEAHGGRAWVESQPGQGSTFGFSLPVINE
jgi:signal transduction histidine kinase